MSGADGPNELVRSGLTATAARRIRRAGLEGIVMLPPVDLFELEKTADTLMVRPVSNLGEFEFAHIDVEMSKLLKLLDEERIRNVVVDFQHCAYFGSSAVGALIRVARAVRDRGGEMVLCNLSKCELEILDVMHLGDLWTIKGLPTGN